MAMWQSQIGSGGGSGTGAPVYTNVAAAQAATGSDNDQCLVASIDTYYRYEADGSGYTVDGTTVLSTGDGGNTRWLAIAGKYLAEPNYVSTVSEEPTGFPIDPATGDIATGDSTISFTDGTLTFQIAPVGATFDVYLSGKKYTKTTETVVITDTEGSWYVYYNDSGVLTATQTFNVNFIYSQALVAILYWDATNNTAIYVGDERHGCKMDGHTHASLHYDVGTAFRGGCPVETLSTDQSGTVAAHAQFGVGAGAIRDEDLGHVLGGIGSTTGLSIFYRDGASGYWRSITNAGYSITTTGTGRMAYNQDLGGGAWQLTEISNNDFGLIHVFAMNDINTPFIAVVGQADYGNLSRARAGANDEINNLVTSGLPFAEFVPVGTVIFQTSNSYTGGTNTTKSRTRTTDLGDDYVDWRYSKISPSAISVTSHSNLSELNVDTHSQYPLLVGRSGGQSLIGGTDTGDDMTITPNSTDEGGELVVLGDVISKGTTWVSNYASLYSNSWHSVAYGNGVFVAVSDSGTGTRVMTSFDGINWENQTSAANNNWWGVCFGAGLFVAVSRTGTNDKVMTSPDGITWTLRANPIDNEWYAVTYGNGLFVAVSGTGTLDRAMTSPDGINWTSRTTPVDNAWQDVTYGNGIFCAISDGGTTDRVMTSPDGITWTKRANSDNYNFKGICYGAGLFVAVAITGTGERVMTSPDGINWTTRSTPADNSWQSVCYGAGLFVAVATTGTGDRVMTSPDGINWTLRNSGDDNNWYGVTYGNGVFVAVSNSGTNRSMASGKQDLPINSILGQDVVSAFGHNDAKVISFDTATYDGPTGVGDLHWDSDNATLALNLSGGSTLQIGQELFSYVYNDTGSQIDNGDAVYITGAFGTVPTIALANAGAFATSIVAGVATQDIANAGYGLITMTGVVRDIDTSAFVAGDLLWLDGSTPGAITKTRPTAPVQQIGLGYCITVNATTGSIIIRPDLSPRLVGLSDVLSASPGGGDVPAWITGNSRFEMQNFNELSALLAAASELYYAGVKKLETTTDGILVAADSNYITMESTGTGQNYGSRLRLKNTNAGLSDHAIVDIGHKINDAGNTTLKFEIISRNAAAASQFAMAEYLFSNDSWAFYCGGEFAITAVKDAGVELYYDNAKKLETDSQGVVVQNAGNGRLIVQGDSNTTSAVLRLVDSGSTHMYGFAMTGTGHSTESDDFQIWYYNGSTYTAFLYYDVSAGQLKLDQPIILANGGAIDEFSTDGTLAGDSDTAVPTEKAVKAYVDAAAGGGALDVEVSATGITTDNSTDVLVITGTGQTVTLHAVATATKKRYDIKNASSGSLTIDGNASETIDGSTTITIPSGESRTLIPATTVWYII